MTFPMARAAATQDKIGKYVERETARARAKAAAEEAGLAEAAEAAISLDTRLRKLNPWAEPA